MLVQRSGQLQGSWSCGVTRSIRKGDRLFLIRLGIPPKGLIASGLAEGVATTAPHWDPRRQNTKALFVDLTFDKIVRTPLITLDELNVRFPTFHWTPQGSGVRIPPGVAEGLKTVWESRMQEGSPLPGEPDGRTVYREGAVRRVLQDAYERNPQARDACIAHYGTRCIVCDFDFGIAYGGVADGFIEVHHLTPLSSVGKEYLLDPIRDLRPICSNCHRVVHMNEPPYTIMQVQRMVQIQSRKGPQPRRRK